MGAKGRARRLPAGGAVAIALAIAMGGGCELSSPEGLARDKPSAAPQLAPAGPASAWNPSTTRAVIVGVLSFADPGITTFSARNRKDQELADVLVARGVPRSNITVLLDGAATSPAVTAALEAQLKASTPGSTLIFYYAGHGAKAESGEVSFLAYDAGQAAPLAVRAITQSIRAGFHGTDVLLMADCCHSGALIDAARELGTGGFRATAITSAEASNTSTANWTYTQSTIDAFRGDPLADRNRDGKIELSEWAAEVRDAMKFRERQRAGIGIVGVPGELVLGAISAPPVATVAGDPAIGSYVVAPRSGGSAVARVVARGPGSATVAFYDYSDFAREDAPLATLAPVPFDHHAPGAKLLVTWGGRTWDADVLKVEDDFHLITYPGWSSWWDEWIASDRIVGTR